MISTKRVGGIRFIRVGRVNVSYSVSKARKRFDCAWIVDGASLALAGAVIVALLLGGSAHACDADHETHGLAMLAPSAPVAPVKRKPGPMRFALLIATDTEVLTVDTGLTLARCDAEKKTTTHTDADGNPLPATFYCVDAASNTFPMAESMDDSN